MKHWNKTGKLLGLLLVVSLLAPILSACAPAEPSTSPLPTPGPDLEPTPPAADTPTSPPAEAQAPLPQALAARDAVLAYLAETLGEQAPAPGLEWSIRRTTPENLVGSESFEFAAGDWRLNLSYPVVAPESMVVTIALANLVSGFEWEGQVDARGQITEIYSTAELPAVVMSPQQARDLALAYMADNLPDVPLPAALTWTEARTTPSDLVGSETMEYTAGDWAVTVSYPVTAPESTIFRVVVANRATGFEWEADVDAMGEITEFGPSGEEPPAPSTGSAQSQLVQGNTRFAFELYRALKGRSAGNLFYSPYSISLALGMTYSGARGETATEMARTLHLDLAQESLHPAFRALAEELAQRGKGARGKEGQAFRLNIANALWGQEGYAFLPEWLDLLKESYGAGLQRVDYARPEEARATINRWVEEQTEDRIKDLIPSGVLDALTRLVLTNAVYFNAAWAKPFEKNLTRDGPFTRLDGSQVTAPMMNKTDMLGYASGSGYQAIELPYDGYELSMVVLLPDAGQFEAFEDKLDAARLDSILKGLAPRQVALSLPKFKFASEFSLKDTLSAMGMPLAFTPDADFSGMNGKQELFLDEVLHKAFVSVDEAGTEAAAATAVVVGVTSMPVEPLVVKVDRPFLFLIRDLKTGSVLFLGRVLDPKQ